MRSLMAGMALALTMGGAVRAEPLFWIGVTDWTAYAIDLEVKSSQGVKTAIVWAINRTPTEMATPDLSRMVWVQKTKAIYDFNCRDRTSTNLVTDWFDFEGHLINSTPPAFSSTTVRDGSADAAILRYVCDGVVGEGWRRMASVDLIVRAYYEFVFDQALEETNPFQLRPPPAPRDRP